MKKHTCCPQCQSKDFEFTDGGIGCWTCGEFTLIEFPDCEDEPSYDQDDKMAYLYDIGAID